MKERGLPALLVRSWLARIALQRNDRAPLNELLASGRPLRVPFLDAHDALIRGELAVAGRLIRERESDASPGQRPLRVLPEILIALHQGQLASGRELFQEYRPSLTPAGSEGPIGVVRAFVRAGDAVLAFGDDELLATAYTALNEAAWFKFPYDAGDAADVLRGALALRLGDVDAAERHYTEGLQWARAPEVRFGLVEGRCLQGLADVAEARGDHALAMQHLDAAAAKFAEYGAKLYLDQVLAKKEVLKA